MQGDAVRVQGRCKMHKDTRCTKCTSKRVQKWGTRRTLSGLVQRYHCENCGHNFSIKIRKRASK